MKMVWSVEKYCLAFLVLFWNFYDRNSCSNFCKKIDQFYWTKYSDDVHVIRIFTDLYHLLHTNRLIPKFNNAFTVNGGQFFYSSYERSHRVSYWKYCYLTSQSPTKNLTYHFLIEFIRPIFNLCSIFVHVCDA